MHSYHSALARYLSCEPLNNRAKKWLAKPHEARPLHSRRHDWKSIHRTPEGVIYFQFWKTHLATFQPPGVDGSYQVILQHYESPTTQGFECQYHICYDTMTAQDGKAACLPYVHGTKTYLWFDEDDRLIRERSQHAPVYTNVLGEKDKAKRALIKAQLGDLVTLMQFRLPQFKEHIVIDHGLGAPFGGATYRGRSGQGAKEIDRLKEVLKGKDVMSFDFRNAEFIDAAVGAAQDVMNILASKRCYKEDVIGDTLWASASPTYVANHAAKEARIRPIRDKILDAITPEEFGKSYMARLLDVFGAKPTGKKDVGQFPMTLPLKWVA